MIPALDEADNIGRVVTELSALPEAPDVLVIDDGSSDDTREVASRMGASVVSMPFNCGIGASVQVGVWMALAGGYEVVARFDGDGQHDPRQLERLRAHLDDDTADFVLASRYLEKSGFQSTFMRRLGSRWFAVLLRAVSGLKITDPTSGCWVANRKAAEVLFEEYSSDYPEVDSLVHLGKSGCRIREISVDFRARAGGRSSIEGLHVLYYMLKVTIALIIGRVRPTGAPNDGDPGWISSSTIKQSPSSARSSR